MTKEEIQKSIALVLTLNDLVRQVAIQVATVRKTLCRDRPEVAYRNWCFTTDEQDTIEAEFEEWYAGEMTYENITFPVWYLWTENYLQIEQQWWAESERQRIIKAEAARLQAEADAAAITEAKERATLLRLKEKYGC